MYLPEIQPTGLNKANATEKLSDGLVAAFPLNSPSTNIIYDFSLFHYEGTLNNLTDVDADQIWVRTDRGWALDFPPTSFNPAAQVRVDNNASHLTLDEAVTISAWINLDRVSGTQTIVFRGSNYALALGDTALYFRYQDGTPDEHKFTTIATPISSTGIWYHVVASYIFENPQSIKLYVDGVNYAGTWNPGDGIVPPNTAANTFLINQGSISEEVDGRIQNVNIWRRALTSDEVELLFHSPWEIYRDFNIVPILVLSELIEVGGGALAGGSGKVNSFAAKVVGGGAVAGGMAIVKPFWDVMDGGALAGGLAEYTVIFANIDGTGGALAGGLADESLGDVVEVGGGVLAGGTADVVLALIPVVGGGVRVGSGVYPNGFKYRRLLTVPAGAVSVDFEKFYLSVSAGLDIAIVHPEGVFQFETVSGTRLYHYLREYDRLTGRFVAVVKTPLTTGSDTTMFLYYGK